MIKSVEEQELPFGKSIKKPFYWQVEVIYFLIISAGTDNSRESTIAFN